MNQAQRDANCVLQELERIDTVKLAARGLSDEANAVGQARIMLDRIIAAKYEPPASSVYRSHTSEDAR